jgi:hypothetical protein
MSVVGRIRKWRNKRRPLLSGKPAKKRLERAKKARSDAVFYEQMAQGFRERGDKRGELYFGGHGETSRRLAKEALKEAKRKRPSASIAAKKAKRAAKRAQKK